MTIWFDVEDLIQFFQNTSRPTGIQRLGFETCRAAQHLTGDTVEVRFCRRAKSGFKPIRFPPWNGHPRRHQRPAPTSFSTTPRRRVTPASRRRPPLALPYRLPLGVIAHAGIAALDAMGDLTRAFLRPKTAPGNRIGGHQFELPSPPITFSPGNWLVNLGASWACPYPRPSSPPCTPTAPNSPSSRMTSSQNSTPNGAPPPWCATSPPGLRTPPSRKLTSCSPSPATPPMTSPPA